MANETVHAHLDEYWHLSQEQFGRGNFGLAAFLAITLIEGIGKLVIFGNAKLGAELDRKGYYNHRTKYSYAVYETLLINSRVARIYDTDQQRFANWLKNDELFALRNSSLYIEIRGTELITPSEAIHRADALLLVCIAGEAYAEIQRIKVGTGPGEWQQIISQVDQFRSISTQNNNAAT